MAPRGRLSRQPSPYPRVLFHLIRIVQLVASSVVLAFLSFFVHYLLEDGYTVPWTFLVLLGVSALTVLSVIGTAYFYHYRVLRPRGSLTINLLLTLIWIAGFGILTWNITGTLSHNCDIDSWSHDVGIMVCRFYKVIETFAAASMLFTGLSLLLDIYTVNKTRSRGVYNQMDDIKRPIINSRGISAHDDFSPRDQAGEESLYHEPDAGFPEYSHEARAPYKPQKEMHAENFGYTTPAENTQYEGAAGRALDRQFEALGA